MYFIDLNTGRPQQVVVFRALIGRPAFADGQVKLYFCSRKPDLHMHTIHI